MKILPLCVIALVGLGGVALAHQGVKNAKVQAWMQAMEQAGQASKVLGRMAKGSLGFDADQAATARSTLISMAEAFPELFQTPAQDPLSEALPAIWENYEDFAQKSAVMRAAAQAMDISSADGLRQGMNSLGRSCSGCHQSYRK